MKPSTLRWWLAAAWLLSATLLYLLVPQVLSMMNFLFIAGVLLLLALVIVAKGRQAATHVSMTDVLYKMDHPSADQKS